MQVAPRNLKGSDLWLQRGCWGWGIQTAADRLLRL